MRGSFVDLPDGLLARQQTVFSSAPQELDLQPRMAQLETLEAKMASIEVSLSTTPRRKKGGSISGGITSPQGGHRNKDQYTEVDALRVALRDKENIIQTLRGQLCNTLGNRLVLRNGAPPLREADRKAAEDRLQRLRRDSDNKRLAIKNLKLALAHLDITDNIDVRIQQAELEYRLGREELELLTLREESRALQSALELAETQEKQKNDTLFSCIAGGTYMTVHAVEVSADPKSPRFGAGPRDDAAGLYVDWAIEDSGLRKGDRILEVNGKLVVGASRSDLGRLLAVAPDAAQIVVLRKNESFGVQRTLRTENLRLTHRIGYLEEQVKELLSPVRSEITVEPPAPRKDTVQFYQKGSQVTALVANLPGMKVRSFGDLRQSSSSRNRHSDYSHKFNSKELDSLMEGLHSKSRHRDKTLQLTRSTASLDCKSHNPMQSHRIRSARYNSSIDLNKTRKSIHGLSSLEFDSEPTYYHMQETPARPTEHSESSVIYDFHQARSRPTPPKKPARLSLHRAASLQSVGGTMTGPPETPKKPTKRNHRGDPPAERTHKFPESSCETIDPNHNDQRPQPPPRTPSRAESCQSALRWPSPKPRSTLTSISIDKWC